MASDEQRHLVISKVVLPSDHLEQCKPPLLTGEAEGTYLLH